MKRMKEFNREILKDNRFNLDSQFIFLSELILYEKRKSLIVNGKQ